MNDVRVAQIGLYSPFQDQSLSDGASTNEQHLNGMSGQQALVSNLVYGRKASSADLTLNDVAVYGVPNLKHWCLPFPSEAEGGEGSGRDYACRHRGTIELVGSRTETIQFRRPCTFIPIGLG